MEHTLDDTLQRLRRVHGGEPWHSWSTLVILENVIAQEAAAHPVPGAHSIWEIVRHMIAWTNEVHRRATGGKPGDPLEGDWPAVGETSEGAWRRTVEDLTAANEALIETARGLTADEARRAVGEGRDAPLGTGFSVQETLEGLVAHHAYHAGQIALLRRALETQRAATFPG